MPYSNHSVLLSVRPSVRLSVRQKTLTLAITFLPLEISLSYLACVILMTRPFQRYHEFWTCDLERDLWPTFEKNFNIGHNFFISAPEPKAQVHYCDHGLSVVFSPSVCLSVVNFSRFRLLLWNPLKEFNDTWQEARTQHSLPSLCFSGRSEKQNGRPGLWLAEIFFISSLKPMNRIQRNLTATKISMSSTKFVFIGPIGKTRWPFWTLIGWDIFYFSSKIAERNSRKLDRK